jgi:uncharacterized protein (TIGR02270 family)
MATSNVAFLIGLYEEYLEEASFLYAQRRALLADPEIGWKKLAGFEQRLEADLDGLVVGESLALELCKSRAAEGDFGEFYAALCVFCRLDRRDCVLTSLDQLDPDDPKKAAAAADALKDEMPSAWTRDFVTLLDSGEPKLAPVLARVFAYNRVPCEPQLLSAVRRCAAPALPVVVWAIGRVGTLSATEPLLDYLGSEEEPVRAAAALALARMGEPRAVDSCLDQARSNSWPILPLCLAGGRRALPLLTELTENIGGADYLTALGLLGDPISIPLLISRLAASATAASAATALQCLTGAGLSETVFVPDELDEAELFEAEREQIKQGKPLDRGDGRPFGSTVTRLSQNPDDWNRWWRTNSSRFTPGMRYRNGGLFSPGRLIEMLSDERTPHQLRRYCSEELATRYQNDFGLETDMPVNRQVAKLAEASIWSQTGSTHFQEGEWYFAGRQRA